MSCNKFEEPKFGEYLRIVEICRWARNIGREDVAECIERIVQDRGLVFQTWDDLDLRAIEEEMRSDPDDNGEMLAAISHLRSVFGDQITIHLPK